MERCPNCGSTVRSGAKFCTTCGFRLPEQVVAEPAAGASVRSPFESTSSVAASRWPSSAGDAEETPPTDAAAPAAAKPTSPDSGTVDGEAAAVAADPEPAAQSDSEAIELGPGGDSPASSEEASDSGIWWSRSGSTWSSSWRSEEQAAEAAAGVNSSSDEAPAEKAAPEGTPADSPVHEAVEADEPDAVVADEFPSQTGDSEAPAIVEPGAFADPGALGDDEAIGTEFGTEPTGDSEAALERAYELIAELRALLPSLASAPDAASSGAEDVAAALEAVRLGADPSEVETLRNAVNAARERPRDIEVILDLSGRLDAIAGILDRHDRYAAAIDDAVTTLRGTAD